MYNRNDPRFRRTLNTISHNLETANETAQVGIFSLTEHCLKPCFYSVGDCITATGSTCFPSGRDDKRTRRAPQRKARARGRPELSFDFYDDWEEDENDALLAWGNEEHDALLGNEAAEGGSGEPSRRRIMNYGSQGGGINPRTRTRRRSTGQPDPTVIPNQSYFGFLDRLPFKIGGKGLRYKPSASGLQDRAPKSEDGIGSTSEEDGSDEGRPRRKHGRKRSATQNSGHTSDSYSSRGDIFPSDEEIDDAVPLDDDYAAELLPGQDDASSGKTRKGRRKSGDPSSTIGKKSTSSSSRRPSKDDTETTADVSETKGQGQAESPEDVDKFKLPNNPASPEQPTTNDFSGADRPNG